MPHNRNQGFNLKAHHQKPNDNVTQAEFSKNVPQTAMEI